MLVIQLLKDKNMMEIVLGFIKRGWKVRVNSRFQIIFIKPNSVKWFCLNGCSEGDYHFIKELLN